MDPPPPFLSTQLPLPLQMRFEPHDVPADAFDWLQTGVPVEQLYVPGAQVVPQAAFGVHADPPVPAPPVPPPAPPEPPAPALPPVPAMPPVPLVPAVAPAPPPDPPVPPAPAVPPVPVSANPAAPP